MVGSSQPLPSLARREGVERLHASPPTRPAGRLLPSVQSQCGSCGWDPPLLGGASEAWRRLQVVRWMCTHTCAPGESRRRSHAAPVQKNSGQVTRKESRRLPTSPGKWHP